MISSALFAPRFLIFSRSALLSILSTISPIYLTPALRRQLYERTESSRSSRGVSKNVSPR